MRKLIASAATREQTRYRRAIRLSRQHPGAIEDKPGTNNSSNQLPTGTNSSNPQTGERPRSDVSHQTTGITFNQTSLYDAKVNAGEKQCVPIGRLNDLVVWAGDCEVAGSVAAGGQGTANSGK